MKSGKVKALAITGVQRSSLYPDLPTVSEAGVPGFAKFDREYAELEKLVRTLNITMN